MGSPNTLLNEKLDNKSRLRDHIEAFYGDFIWDEKDPRLEKVKDVWGNFHPDPTTKKYLAWDFFDRHSDPLNGDEWAAKYPTFYLKLDKSHQKVILQSNLHNGNTYGFWDNKSKTLVVQSAKQAREDSYPKFPLRLTVHEYQHSIDYGLGSDDALRNYQSSDWFHDSQINDDGSTNFVSVMDGLSRSMKSDSLKDITYDGYVQRAIDYIDDNFIWRIQNRQTKDGYIADQFIGEIIARSTSDVAASNCKHDDISFLFTDEIYTIFSTKLLDKIRLMSWPRLPENKMSSLDLFKGKSIWD